MMIIVLMAITNLMFQKQVEVLQAQEMIGVILNQMEVLLRMNG